MPASETSIDFSSSAVMWLVFLFAILAVLAIISTIGFDVDIFALLTQFVDMLKSNLTFLQQI